MGKINDITKKYMKHNDRFADVCNYYLFNGESVIRADELEEKDITELGVFGDCNNKVKSIQKLRDILRRCVVKSANGVVYMVIGIENQTDVNYAMVIRNMVYDALNYASQVEDYTKEHRNKKDLEGAEFLSGLAKTDKLMPVVTITIYWNSGKWDGARSLHEMLAIDNDEIRRRYLESESSEYSKLSTDAVILLNECVKADIKISEDEGDEKDMCKGIKDLIEEERNAAILEGEIKGEELMSSLINKLIMSNRMKELQDMTTDKELRECLYKEYGIK